MEYKYLCSDVLSYDRDALAPKGKCPAQIKNGSVSRRLQMLQPRNGYHGLSGTISSNSNWRLS
jgi:hypothetical protein